MGAHARQLSRLRLKSLSILKPEINGEFCAILLEIEANFQPLALVTYARYDPAVKNKHSIHDVNVVILRRCIDPGWVFGRAMATLDLRLLLCSTAGRDAIGLG